MTLNINRSKATKHVTTTPQSQIILHFPLQLADFELQVNFETSPLRDPKLTLNAKGQRYPLVYMLQPPPSPKYSSVSLYEQTFLSYRPFWDRLTKMTQKWPWILKGQRYPIYIWQLPLSPKFQSISLYDYSHFKRYWQFFFYFPIGPNVKFQYIFF